MNKYTLQFQSREFEFAFFQNENGNANIILKIGTLINIIQSIILITYYIIEDQAKTSDRIVSIAFFVVGIMSWIVKLILKRQSKAVNLFLFAKNIIVGIMVCSSQMLKQQNNKNQEINYQPLLGVILTIEILTSIQGTNFLYKIGLFIINLTLFGFAFYGDRSTGLILTMSFGAIYFLSFTYLNDKMKRDLFLDKQKSTEQSFLIDKLLPINIVVMKYNPKEERSFLHQVNRKAENTFNISDNDAFKEFSKRVIIQQDTQEQYLGQSYHDLFAGKNPAVNGQRDQEKTLFFYVESIAKENYLRQKKEVNRSNEKKQSLKSDKNSRVVTRTDRIGSISKMQRNKINSVFERPKKYSDDINKYNDKVNSGEKDRRQRYSLFEPSKVGSIDRSKNNSIERPKLTSMDRPKNLSIERTGIMSHEKASHQSAERNKNNSQEKQNSNERSKKISFDKDKINNPHMPAHRGNRSSTVKMDVIQNNPAAGGGGGRFVRRGQKKGTVLRKVSNFNLKPGVANAKVKYGEDVYDRIDILTGIYTEKDGQQRLIQIKIYTYNVNEQYQVILIEDETLEGQVKYLTELNKFLYRSFQDSLEQFRMPLAYTLIKLNDAYKDTKTHNNNIYKEEKDSPKSCTNLNQNVNTTNNNQNRTEGNRQSFTYIQQSEFSLTNISPVSRQQHKNMMTNNSQFQSYINNYVIKNPENSSARNDDTKYSQSMNNLQSFNQENGSSRRRRISYPNEQHDKLYESIDNTRYYGFITLNSIYNYIDYVTLLQKKQLELRITEISMKRVMDDIISIIECQGLKKKVRIMFINELKYDRVTTDERRIKQLLLNFLIHILHKIKKGYIIIRASVNTKSLETIKITIYNSGNYAYPIYNKARFRLNSIEDIYNARSNKDCLEQAINSQIIGRLGPYDKITLTNSNSTSGTTLSFAIYTDVNILNFPQKFISSEDLDLQYQAAFKSVVNVQQEGEISNNSSYDANFAMNKLTVENFNNVQSRQFFPSSQFQDIATMYDKDEQPQSSKKQTNFQARNSLYFDYQNQNNGSFQEASLHPVVYSSTPIQLEPFQQQNNFSQRNSKNNQQLDDTGNGYFAKGDRQQYDQDNQDVLAKNQQEYDDDDEEQGDQGEEEQGQYKNYSKYVNQKLKDQTNNESFFSHHSKENKSINNSFTYRMQQDHNTKRIINKNELNQIEQSKKITSIDMSKCFINNPSIFEQSEQNISQIREIEASSLIQLQKIQQGSLSNKNNQKNKQKNQTETYESNQWQKIPQLQYDTAGYYNDEKNESKLTINQFSSRQLNQNQYSPTNNDDPLNMYAISGYIYPNQQKPGIIKLQQSEQFNNNADQQDQHKVGLMNIISLKHIS